MTNDRSYQSLSNIATEVIYVWVIGGNDMEIYDNTILTFCYTMGGYGSWEESEIGERSKIDFYWLMFE